MLRFFRTKKGNFIIAAAVLILLIFLHYLNIIRPIENAIIYASNQTISFLTRKANQVVGFFSLITSIRDLNRENEKLRAEKDRLLLENAQLKELGTENESLRAQLDLQAERGISGVLAEIIMRNPDSISQSIVINKGEADGIKANAPVVYAEGMLVGRVIEVSAHSAKVLLITDQNSVISALVSESRASGNITGQHGLGLFMDLIPQTDVVNIGDEVITSGFAGELPKGFLIGEVIEVQSSANQLFQKAQIRPYVNFSKLERVLVITDPSSIL